MATTTHVGDTRALVFPVMCDGHLKIEYDDYNSDDLEGSNTIDESKHPLWDYGGPFSIEAIITPYDVNGIGHRSSGQGRLDSTKTPPSPNLSLDDQADTTSNYQSVSYFGANRGTHKMMLFANSYLKFYLQNTTSSNFNQPAEYKLVVEITDSVGTPITHTIDSDAPVFVSKKTMHGYYDANNPSFYNGISTSLKEVSTSATAALDQASIQVTGDLTSFTNTEAVPATLATGTITVTNQPSSSELDVAASAGTNATGAIVFSTGWSGGTAIQTNTSASNNNAVILRNRQTGTGGSSNKTYRFFKTCNGCVLNAWPSEMVGTGARSYTFTDIENDQVTGGASLAEDLSSLGYGASDTQIDVFVPEFGNAGGGNTTGANWRWMLGAAINQVNGSGSNPSSGLDITATDLTSTSGIAGTINLVQDASGAAGNHSTTPNTGPVIGSTIADSGKLTATVFGGTGMTVGTDATSASNVDYYITVTMRNASGGSPVTKYFKFFSGSFTAGALDTNSTTSVSPVHKVMIGGSTTATASHLANAINNAFTGTGFSGTEASNNNSSIVTITSPNTGTQSGQTLSTVSGYSGIISIGSNPFSNYAAGSSAVTPTAFITLTDSAGNVIRYKPSKGDNSETTGSTGTENSGVTYFLVDASDNDATAANLRSAILNNSSGHAQFSPALSASITSNTITLTATAASGSHALASTGISSGLSLTNFTGGSANTFTVGSGEADDIGAGNGIYDNAGTLIGTVSSVSGNNITLSAAYATTLTSTIYTEQNREALYLEQIAKVGVSFNKNTISLFINNQLVKRAKVNIGKFRLNANDCYIGQDGSLNAANRKATQFMGELYEIAFHKSSEPCLTKSTLTPNYSDTLFYYSFGD